MTITLPTIRKLLAATVAVALAASVLAGAQPAQASTSNGVVQCAKDMASITAPAAGQSHTFLRIYFWNGSQWQKWTEGTFAGPVYFGSLMVNAASGTYWVPSGYIHVQLYGFYSGTGWVKYGVGHFQAGGSQDRGFCQA